ncbi:MAG TPA: DUF3465 domain-containing protein [Lysobacter sp.]|nr:DUF3465 domain-containing protein [Lysobacter sp.]
MRRHLPLLAACALLAAGAAFWDSRDTRPAHAPTVATQDHDVAASTRSDAILANAFEQQRRSFQVEGSGEVVRVLADDDNGSRHQRFILRLGSGQTLLVAHNIDLARRIAGLAEGDTVAFSGEYEWSHQGGVIHWTHHDPDGRHAAGWLRHEGVTYQ